MSSAARTLLLDGLAQGISLDALAAAVATLRENDAPAPVSSAPGHRAQHTLDFLESAGHEVQATAGAVDPTGSAGSGQQQLGLERYEDLGRLGMGGMGEVRRVRDRYLGRTLALKTLHEAFTARPTLVARFREEAQATAQLQHPGIVPIYDLGQLPDGRLWFTMKEVSGQTLGQVIEQVHASSSDQGQVAPGGWSLRRLVAALRQVCEAVGYAHSRGVVHRDLKPDNIMVGEHGEVLVLDWGLAKVLRRSPGVSPSSTQGAVQTDRSTVSALETRIGAVAGTPAFMPPEQALGRVDAVGPQSDVYALGAILYCALSGHSPYRNGDAAAVLAKVRRGPPEPLVTRIGVRVAEAPATEDGQREQPLPLPVALVEACERAMHRDPTQRFGTATALGAELQAWLDGAKRRDDGLAVLEQAAGMGPAAAALRRRAAHLRAEAATALAAVKPWQPEREKQDAWQQQDEAAALEREAELVEVSMEQLLQASLTHAPGLPEAHAALAWRYRGMHMAAEAARVDAARSRALFVQHLEALPRDHPDRPGHATYLQGDGALTLVTDPPGAEVLLHRFVLRNRRMVPRFERSLGRTPLTRVRLPMGSYLCLLRLPDRPEVRYPVCIERGEHWHGEPPEGEAPHPVVLPADGELGPDECLVPAGWFRCGGDPHEHRSLPARRVWTDSWVVRRFPVTNREFLAFLDDLVSKGRTEAALRWAPRERGGTVGAQGALIYGFDGQRFSLRPDADGDTWEPEVPVCMVDWYGATAFASWEAERTGLSWRLPGELLWEKAARGVDGRYHPWGDAFDPSWASMRHSHPGPVLPTPVGRFPTDESVYGIRDLAGSMADWCEDPFRPDGPATSTATPGESAVADPLRPPARRVSRGGAWSLPASPLRASARFSLHPSDRLDHIGFRLVRALTDGS